MKLSDGSSTLEITFLELGRDQQGDQTEVRLEACAESLGFAGKNDRIWIFRESFGRFVDALRSLDRDRRGEAVLQSMSPDDFRVRIGTIDGAGHIGVQGWIGRVQMGPRQDQVQSQVAFNFELDGSSFPAIVDGLSALIPDVRNA